MLTRLAITLSLGAAACLALAAIVSVPGGVQAAREIAAADDPVRLVQLALDRSFDAPVAAREIEQALAARSAAFGPPRRRAQAVGRAQ